MKGSKVLKGLFGGPRHNPETPQLPALVVTALLPWGTPSSLSQLPQPLPTPELTLISAVPICLAAQVMRPGGFSR